MGPKKPTSKKAKPKTPSVPEQLRALRKIGALTAAEASVAIRRWKDRT